MTTLHIVSSRSMRHMYKKGYHQSWILSYWINMGTTNGDDPTFGANPSAAITDPAGFLFDDNVPYDPVSWKVLEWRYSRHRSRF